MFETPEELATLQSLFDASLGRATAHLRSITRPGATALDAATTTGLLTGMCTSSIATVTARGDPRISGIDGHFLHGHWIVGTARGAAKARHLAVRPAVSLSHLRGEELGVFTHGSVEELNPTSGAVDPAWGSTLAHLTAHYGQSPLELGDVVYYRVRPSWMVAYAAGS